MKKNNYKGFGFLDSFGMSGNARLILVFFVLGIMANVSLCNLDLSGKFGKWVNALHPVTTIEGKLIYIKALDEFVSYPPYGEIYLYDFNTHSTFEKLSNDFAVEVVLDSDRVILYYSDDDGEKLYTFSDGSLNLLLSSKEEIVDFEFGY